MLATPVGLVLAGALAAASAVEYRLDASLRIVRHSRLLTALVLAIIAAWAVVSLAELPPLRDSVTPEDVELPLSILATVGVPLYAFAAFAYFRVWARRRTRLALAVAFAFALLAEALVVAVASLADELAAELVGVARADGDQLRRDRRRHLVRVVRGALQRRCTSTRRSPAIAT